jgi:hypothetical protein
VLDQNRSQLGRRPPIVKSVPGVQEQVRQFFSLSFVDAHCHIPSKLCRF